MLMIRSHIFPLDFSEASEKSEGRCFFICPAGRVIPSAKKEKWLGERRAGYEAHGG
jgi:hypothetical protein